MILRASLLVTLLLAFCLGPVLAVELPLVQNPDFEVGDGVAPLGWTLSEGAVGAWEAEGARSGTRLASLTGDGEKAGQWLSEPLELRPGKLYRIQVWARLALGSSGGCLTLGTDTVNRDFYLGADWQQLSFIFAADKLANPVQLHLGQWMLKGKVWFDNLEFHAVEAVSSPITRSLFLGSDEFIEGATYYHLPQYSGAASSYSRPLAGYTCNFNSNRWPIGGGNWLLYSYDLPGQNLRSAKVSVDVGYYTEGELLIEYSTDGETFVVFGRLKGLGNLEAEVPALAFLASKLYIRLRSLGSLQVYGYNFTAELSEALPEPARGNTDYVVFLQQAPDVVASLAVVNPPVAGKYSLVTLEYYNSGQTDQSFQIKTAAEAGLATWEDTAEEVFTLPGRKRAKLRAVYKTPGAGPLTVRLLALPTGGGAPLLEIEWEATASPVDAADYGHYLADSSKGKLWWAEGTYKVGRERLAPDAGAESTPVKLEAARNEFEPVQLVVSPTVDIERASIQLTDLKGPGGAVIPPSAWSLKQVKYVFVTRATDAFGAPGYWPDPLVDLTGPVALEAGQNQPFWLLLHVPKEASAGLYEGTLSVELDGETSEVPLQVRVFDFTLSDETHTKTAYGVGPNYEWFGPLSEPQKDEVFDLFMQVCRDHRISPYTPYARAPYHWSLAGPGFEVKTGRWQARADEFGTSLLGLGLEDESPLVTLGNCLTMFEEDVIGYQGTGESWPGLEGLKDLTVVHQDTERLVIEATGFHSGSREAERRYEARFKLTFLAGKPYFLMQPIWLKNTDTMRWQARAIFGLLTTAQGSPDSRNEGDWGAWLWSEATVGAIDTSGSGQWGFSLRPGHGDVATHPMVFLNPDETVPLGIAPLAVFVARATDWAEVEQVVAEVKADLASGSGIDPGAPKLAFARTEQGEPSWDLAAFDEAMERYLDGYKFNAFNVGNILPSSLGGYGWDTPEYQALHKRLFGAFEQHLAEKGWLDEAYCYWVDEPTPAQYDYVNQGMGLLKASVPGIARLLTEQPEPELFGYTNLWVPILSEYRPEICQARQAAGDQMWWYVCCGPTAPYPNNFVDHPAINHRIRFWMMEKYGVEGSLYWETCWWWGKGYELRSPWQVPMSINPEGGYWGNGDGMLLYPPLPEPSKTPLVTGPVVSQRFELLREGLEDREYFWLLGQLIEQAPEGEAKQAASAVLAEAKAVAESLTTYTNDPQVLYELRRRVAESVEKLTPR